MSDKQEMMADIVAEMRNLGKLDKKSNDMITRSLMGLGLQTYADRIEAAWKRECDFPKSQSVDADKLTGKDINGVIDDLLKSSKYYYHRGDIVQGQFCRVTADRIKEAWKREKAELEALALSVGGMVEASRHKQVGNAAAMREALVAMVKAETDGSMEREDLCGRCLEKMFDKCKHDGSCWVDNIMNAISEPPRNCDRFMSIEQARTAYCSECGRIITIWDGYVAGLFEEWLFSPATERKGENNEK